MASARPDPHETSSPSDWKAIHPLLERCAIGPPQGRRGTFPGVLYTICQMLRGSVVMEKDGCRVEATAKDPVWILTTPGTRTQHFSEDAEIISIHFAPGNSANGAEWKGPPIACAQTDEASRQSLENLCTHPAVARLSFEEQINFGRLEWQLDEYLQLQILTLNLFRQALRLAATVDQRFEIPTIEDPRVRSSHRYLAGLDIRQSFSRNDLALRAGITAGQLDRLWRRELGLTPNQFRDQQRLTHACEQLRQADIPIKAIAADLGFVHLSQFSNWFHTRHGESPRSYRKRPGTN
ncbi:helix-turn-helix domain-containing protein [Puniceicoccus vermicola]|nr:AraC family transcriptional regulator [Puniceicoccus vermicola]